MIILEASLNAKSAHRWVSPLFETMPVGWIDWQKLV